jgi:hypothetical protein
MASIDTFGLQALRFFISRTEGSPAFWTVGSNGPRVLRGEGMAASRLFSNLFADAHKMGDRAV